MSRIAPGAKPDAELVVAAARGDHDAFGQLYDRYSARIHDLCLQLLRNPDDAADATADVFLAAAEHIDQLRDPARCKSWLYAIARHEIYRRSRRAARERPVDMDDEMIMNPNPIDEPEDALAPAEHGQLVTLLREASLGLDERDRLVLELSMAAGLDGRGLADALGVSENGAHQAAHRMRERLARSVGALMVARQGRAECGELQRLLEPWDGTYTVVWRKRVARHVDRCDVCAQRRRALPAALLDGTAFAATPITFVAAPAAVRARVLAGMHLGGGARWTGEGFPPGAGHRRRLVATAAAVAGLVAVGIALAVVLGGGHGAVHGQAAGLVHTTASTTASNTSPAAGATGRAGPTTSVAAEVAPASSIASPATDVGGATTPSGVASGHAAPPPASPSPTTSTSAGPPDTSGPSLTVSSSPGVLSTSTDPACSNPPLVATASDPSGVASVTMHWSDGSQRGDVALTRTGPTTWQVVWHPVTTLLQQLTFTATDTRGNASQATRTIRSVGCAP